MWRLARFCSLVSCLASQGASTPSDQACLRWAPMAPCSRSRARYSQGLISPLRTPWWIRPCCLASRRAKGPATAAVTAPRERIPASNDRSIVFISFLPSVCCYVSGACSFTIFLSPCLLAGQAKGEPHLFKCGHGRNPGPSRSWARTSLSVRA